MTEPRIERIGATHEGICDLQARLLTLATFITELTTRYAPNEDFIPTEPKALNDAKSLLIEASGVLEFLKPPPFLGEPMAVIEAKPLTGLLRHHPENWDNPYWIDPGPDAGQHSPSRNACPKCDSRASKIVRGSTTSKRVVLECQACSYEWPWRPKGSWV